MKSLLTILIVVLFEFLAFSYSMKPVHHRSRRHHKKPHRRVGNQQLYGVSLSSITGFEKPMIPPHIINFDLPIDYERPPVKNDIFALDLPSKVDFFANNPKNTTVAFPTQLLQ
jgi:hypothetical protein